MRYRYDLYVDGMLWDTVEQEGQRSIETKLLPGHPQHLIEVKMTDNKAKWEYTANGVLHKCILERYEVDDD